MRRLSKVIGLVFVSIVLMAVDCPPKEPPAPGPDIVLKDTAFDPDTLTVAIGASVLWLHDDGGRPHTVTSKVLQIRQIRTFRNGFCPFIAYLVS